MSADESLESRFVNGLRVAVIGAGPAGFYAAASCFKEKNTPIHVDMFERLPSPYGLVRFGVAPDHDKIKSVSRVYDKIASNERFRYFGNVEYGGPKPEGCEHYDHVLRLNPETF